MVGAASGDFFRSSVSISANGKSVAAGASCNSDNSDRSSHVRIFTYSDANELLQVGNAIVGAVALDQFGNSASLSSDGKTVAAVATGNDDNGSNSGHVRIFTCSSYANGWYQVGDTIVGAESGDWLGDQFGSSASMSVDGKTVAAGASCNDDNGSVSGHVRIFTCSSTSNK